MDVRGRLNEEPYVAREDEMRPSYANIVFGGLQHTKFVSPKRMTTLRKGSLPLNRDTLNMTYTSKNFATSLIEEARNRDTFQTDKIG